MRTPSFRCIFFTFLGLCVLRVNAAATFPQKFQKHEDDIAVSSKRSIGMDEHIAKRTEHREIAVSWNELPKSQRRWTISQRRRSVEPNTNKKRWAEQLASSDNHQSLSFPYGQEKVRGVNLGGWLVLEPWITPSIFEQFPVTSGPVDEYTLTKRLGKNEAHRQLFQHWSTWIQEQDFRSIASYGLNLVRIPIGYWAIWLLPNDPYVQGQLEFMDKAIKWARTYGLKVWIDLHGAPGSQNGFDNSGWRDHIEWQTGATLDGVTYARHTVGVIKALAKRYAGYKDVVLGIELLNEPLPGPEISIDQVKQYYRDGYDAVRDYTQTIPVVLHDAFQAVTSWNGFMSSSPYKNVIIDTHQYQVFTPGLVAMSEQQHVDAACGFGRSLQSVDKWTVVGEWSGAWTDCAKWLNGYGRYSRYEGQFPGSWKVGICGAKESGRVQGLSPDEQARLKTFIEAQLDAYEQAAGWIFWTWKTQGAPEWDMQALLSANLFPVDPNKRQYKCGF